MSTSITSGNSSCQVCWWRPDGLTQWTLFRTHFSQQHVRCWLCHLSGNILFTLFAGHQTCFDFLLFLKRHILSAIHPPPPAAILNFGKSQKQPLNPFFFLTTINSWWAIQFNDFELYLYMRPYLPIYLSLNHFYSLNFRLMNLNAYLTLGKTVSNIFPKLTFLSDIHCNKYIISV